MVCELNIKEYEAIIQLMVDLDRQQIVYPITTDNAVILTTLKESPITLAEYLSKIKEYSQEGVLSLYERLLGENPEGKAYKATDGLLLEDRISIVNNGLDVLKNKLLNLEDSLEGEDNIQSDLNVLKDKIHNLELIIQNLEYEYEVILFKVTDDLNLDPNGNIITPAEPYITSDGEFSEGWDINYSNLSINKYIWMATTIVKIKNNIKTYLQPWKVSLLYDNEGNYVGGSEKYEKKIYYRTLNYTINLSTPGNNLLGTGWTLSPLGVSSLYPYEYVSCRWYTVDETPLGEWSTPVLWSRWGASGKDSADIEYIYCALSEKLSPEANWPYNDGSNPEEWTNDEQFLLSEYIRGSQSNLWFVNPVSLTTQYPYQYVSIRKRSYSSSTDSYIWDSYSKPVLWSSLGKDGNSQGDQGLMGPVIRFKGYFDPNNEYVNMRNETTLNVDGIRYIDVVKAGENYYMVKPIEGGTRRTSNSPINNLSEWIKVEDFSLIATEVLYTGNELDDKTFWYNERVINLPTFTLNEHKVIYILLDNSNPCVINVNNNNYRICNLENNIWNIYLNSLTLSNNCLYTLVSNYDSTTNLYKWYISSSSVITLLDSQEIREVALLFDNHVYPMGADKVKIIPDFRSYLSSPNNSLPPNYHSTVLAILHPYAGTNLLANTLEIYLKDSDYFYIVLPKYCCARLYKHLGNDSLWSNNSSEVKTFMEQHKDPSKIGTDKIFEVDITADMTLQLKDSVWNAYWGQVDNYYHYVNKKQDNTTGNDYYVYRGTDDDCYYEKNIECFYSISGEFIEVDLDELELTDYARIYPLNGSYPQTYIQELYSGDNLPTRPKDQDLTLIKLRSFYKEIAGADVKIYKIKISGNRLGDHFYVPKGENLSRELDINIGCMMKDNSFQMWHSTYPETCLSSILYGSAMKFMANRNNIVILKNVIKSYNPNMSDSEAEDYINNHWNTLDWLLYLYFITSNSEETPYKIEIYPQWKEDAISFLDMNTQEYQNFKNSFRIKYELLIGGNTVHPMENIPLLDIKNDIMNGYYYGNICGFISESNYDSNQSFLRIFGNPWWAKSLDPDWSNLEAANQELKSPCNIRIFK